MKLSGLIIGLGILILIQACKTEVAQWRGPQRNGIYDETNLLDQWPDEGPELLWVYKGIGRGYAAPSVAGDMLYVNGELDGESLVFAIDLEGKLRWTSPNGKEFLGEGFSSTYPGARSTPTVYGKHLYTSSGQGRITCLEAATGKEVWGLDLISDLGGELGYFGYSESLAVDKEHVYCFPAGPETNFAALDRFTGELVWSSEVLRDTFAYGSPLLVDLPDRKILINTSRHHLFTLDRINGDLLASYPIEGYEYDGEHCNTPVYDKGNIYFVGNDVEGQGAFRVALSGDGKKISELWRNQEIKNNFGGLVTVDDHLFTMVKGNRLVSLDPETGAISDTLNAATGSLVFADNKFFCYGNNGTVNLVTYNEDELKIGGTFKVREGSGHHFSHPVLSGQVLYIRHGDALMAYKIGK